MTKDELRAELERQAQRFTNVYGGEITTYAAEREPERKPWRKKPTVRDQVFQRNCRSSNRKNMPIVKARQLGKPDPDLCAGQEVN